MTEKELNELEKKKEINRLEILNTYNFIKLMLKATYLGICFVLIIVPLIIIFG